MSAEGKKKRGESGKANAEASPFRLNGRAPDWEARQRGCYTMAGAASSGRKTLMALMYGQVAMAAGYGRPAGAEAIYDRMLAHAEDRIPDPFRRLRKRAA